MWKTSINRTILECKEEDLTIGKIFAKVLIEPYWNVKQGCTLKGYNVYYVLIEPYWNVKIAELGMNAGFYVVLIEPYWKGNSALGDRYSKLGIKVL